MIMEPPRLRMVREQLASRGIRDPRVLDAFRKVPRHLFVPEEVRDRAHEDRALEIGLGQTISQPYMAACMTEALHLSGGEKVLEIGTGSGYQTALLLELGARVCSIERLSGHSDRARANLEHSGFRDAHLKVGDGTLGWSEEAPFDRVIVTAGAPWIPRTLLSQVRAEGWMIVPVGGESRQELLRVSREGGRIVRTRISSCVFVKLLGKEGW